MKVFGKECKKKGILTLKFLSTNSGVCDRLLVYRSRTYFVELKTEDKHSKLSKLQIKFMKDMWKQGVAVKVLYCKSDIDNLIERIIKRRSRR